MEDNELRFKTLDRFKIGSIVGMDPFLHDVKGFFPHLNEIRGLLQIQKLDLDEARITLNTIKKGLCPDLSDCKVVSIHIRTKDYASHIKRLYRLPHVLKTNYISRAVDFILKRYKVSAISCKSDHTSAAFSIN